MIAVNTMYDTVWFPAVNGSTIAPATGTTADCATSELLIIISLYNYYYSDVTYITF